jgi:hypothetical protein
MAFHPSQQGCTGRHRGIANRFLRAERVMDVVSYAYFARQA